MQRQSQETNVSVSFEYTRGYKEAGSITTDDICTPEAFLENYEQLCADKKMIFNKSTPQYPAGTYKVKLVGMVDGKTLDKSFVSLEGYRNFLIQNDLIPNKIKRLEK